MKKRVGNCLGKDVLRLTQIRCLATLAMATYGFANCGAANAQAIGGEIVRNPVNGHYYQRHLNYSGLTERWQELQTFALSQGGYLVTITDQSEQDFVWNSFGSDLPYLINDQLGIYSTLFTGGFLDTDGLWKWVTGESFDYTNWHPGEPNGQYSVVLAKWVSGVQWYGTWGDEFFKYSDWKRNPYTIGFVMEWNNNPVDAGGEQAVPEPGEWAAMGILGAGLAGLVIRKRRVA